MDDFIRNVSPLSLADRRLSRKATEQKSTSVSIPLFYIFLFVEICFDFRIFDSRMKMISIPIKNLRFQDDYFMLTVNSTFSLKI